MTEDEMAGWHHWLDGHESGWTPGVGDGQGGVACCDSWGPKELDTTERLNWTELKELRGADRMSDTRTRNTSEEATITTHMREKAHSVDRGARSRRRPGWGEVAAVITQQPHHVLWAPGKHYRRPIRSKQSFQLGFPASILRCGFHY